MDGMYELLVDVACELRARIVGEDAHEHDSVVLNVGS